MSGPLAGVKVLELTRVGPGAYCTMMLADMGAEVLKIEAPPVGTLAGSGTSPRSDEAKKIATSFVNRNKRSMTLNLKTPEAQAILHDLATRYDVLVEGFRPGIMKRLGGGLRDVSRAKRTLDLLFTQWLWPGWPLSRLPSSRSELSLPCGSAQSIGRTGQTTGDSSQYRGRLRGGVFARSDRHCVGVICASRNRKGQWVDISYLDTTLSLLAATPNVRDYFF